MVKLMLSLFIELSKIISLNDKNEFQNFRKAIGLGYWRNSKNVSWKMKMKVKMSMKMNMNTNITMEELNRPSCQFWLAYPSRRLWVPNSIMGKSLSDEVIMGMDENWSSRESLTWTWSPTGPWVLSWTLPLYWSIKRKSSMTRITPCGTCTSFCRIFTPLTVTPSAKFRQKHIGRQSIRSLFPNNRPIFQFSTIFGPTIQH